MKTYEIPYDLDHETELPNINLVLSNYSTIKWLGSAYASPKGTSKLQEQVPLLLRTSSLNPL